MQFSLFQNEPEKNMIPVTQHLNELGGIKESNNRFYIKPTPKNERLKMNRTKYSNMTLGVVVNDGVIIAMENTFITTIATRIEEYMMIIINKKKKKNSLWIEDNNNNKND